MRPAQIVIAAHRFSHRPTRLFLDLDRTVFDTPRFMQAVFAATESQFGLSAQRLHDDSGEFYEQIGDLIIYDLFNQLAAYGVDPSVAEPTLRQALAGHDFLYPDTHGLLAFIAKNNIDTTLLSFGTERYQQFKYSLAPSLQKLPLVTTLYKDVYLQAQGTDLSLLVDDKTVDPLPPNCVQLLVDRTSDDELAHISPQLWRINSLKSVETAWNVGYNEPNQEGTSA